MGHERKGSAPICYGSDGPVFLGRDFEERNSYSEATAATIDSEVRAIIERQYARAKKLLAENRSILDNMARVLVERETIYTAEVDMLMQGASYTEVLEYMEKHDKGSPDDPFGVRDLGAAAREKSGETTEESRFPEKKREMKTSRKDGE